MPQNNHLESLIAEEELHSDSAGSRTNPEAHRLLGAEFASHLGWLPGTPTSQTFMRRARRLSRALKPVFALVESKIPPSELTDDLRWLRDNISLIYPEMAGLPKAVKPLRRLPHARNHRGQIVPRALALAEFFLESVGLQFDEQGFSAFIHGFQQTTPLELRELWAIIPALKIALIEQIALRGRLILRDPKGKPRGIGVCIRSLRDVVQAPWKDVIEPLIVFDQILREDPSGAYARMDFDSRNLYRDKLAKIARRSDFSEVEVARAALALARLARDRVYRDPRIADRESHVGYYIVAEGKPQLCQKVGCTQVFVQSLRALLRRHPDEFFLPGIAILTFSIITAILLWLTPPYTSPALVLLSMLIVVLPASQSAVQLMNYIVTALLPAQILPKLDFSEGIPDEFLTLVAVPTLLLNEQQVRGLVDDLEVRFLGNHDPNVHFALLSDLPDSDQPATEDSPLVDLASSLIQDLNEKYAGQNMGSFFLLHRHRVYNPREKGWMGWERKRGKLMDLNRLLRGQYDSFPIKVGDTSILPRVQFVLTLDSDTELPRGAAHRMIGTLAHPLNRAIIDPQKNIVVSGYGILQPRVGVSVQSTARSRLAAIYAGETGFDIYTRAISDAYQDLYGEGSFTGKGIYEVDSILRVLARRFPRNALLSHDLIEGAYARSGLASDIEVIEDYPSHYSAYNRRKHRWLRGDWQIVQWLTSEVPDESGDRVPNPISLVSRWKIFDNLRRSLVEPATFLLLLVGWLISTGRPARWTIATFCILFIPVLFQLIFGAVKAIVEKRSATAREALTNFYAGCFTILLTFVFLAHQMLLSVDAVIRALVRRTVTRERLLEWETAAQAEEGARRTPIDRYLDLMPLIAPAVFAVVWLIRPSSILAALPILVLWACSKLVSIWLNESPTPADVAFPRRDIQFIRNSALHTWRYFAEYSTEEHNWLIPDNIQEQPPALAARFSPTNVGLLLNARQVACELGYLTVPELADLTQRTLRTLSSIPKHGGHLLNWYDTRTLEPLPPQFVSSVDSGNLLASLWTLQQGFLDRLRQPLLQPSLAQGLLDYLRVLTELRAFPRKELARCESDFTGENWLPSILALPESVFDQVQPPAKSKYLADIDWLRNEARARLQNIKHVVRNYAPWWLPEFAPLRAEAAFGSRLAENLSLQLLPAFLDALDDQLTQSAARAGDLSDRLLRLIPKVRANARRLIEDLRRTAAQAGELANDMDFSFLLNSRRQLLSVGYDVQTKELHSACYELLATEPRTAVFVAIAKEDIPQESWFKLGRVHTQDHGRLVLLSWTGTMFEYLMPALWLRTYSNTLLDRTRIAAVRSQQAYAANRGIPWGISESAYYKLDAAGNYQYRAIGVPQLAMMKTDENPLVISPYSTFLALPVDPVGALRNLRRMEDLGWFGSYGFYESADYTVFRSRFRWSRCQIVRSWMAHHQGMSLLAMANFLCDNVVQRWFHSDRRIQATALLLHEKPVAHIRQSEIPHPSLAA